MTNQLIVANKYFTDAFPESLVAYNTAVTAAGSDATKKSKRTSGGHSPWFVPAPAPDANTQTTGEPTTVKTQASASTSPTVNLKRTFSATEQGSPANNKRPATNISCISQSPTAKNWGTGILDLTGAATPPPFQY